MILNGNRELGFFIVLMERICVSIAIYGNNMWGTSLTFEGIGVSKNTDRTLE